jgi:hypothetical protein
MYTGNNLGSERPKVAAVISLLSIHVLVRKPNSRFITVGKRWIGMSKAGASSAESSAAPDLGVPRHSV